MCSIWNCFAWTLDLIQRAITLCLACCAVGVMCLGLIITVSAGIAYGYNYSLAEFITFSKSNVTVYMRRGQFHDNPDLVIGGNRRMGDEDDVFSSKITSDYEEHIASNIHSEPLSDKWMKDQDVRDYARKLTKFSSDQGVHTRETEPSEQQVPPQYTITSLPTRSLSKILVPIPTTMFRSGSSEIIMRKFLPLNDITQELQTKEPNDYFYEDNKYTHTRKSEIEYSERPTIQPDVNNRFEDIPERNLMPINLKDTHDADYSPVEGDEDNIVYKPV